VSKKTFRYLRKEYAVTNNCFYPAEDKRRIILTEIVLHSAGQYEHRIKLCAEKSKIKIPEDKNYGPCIVLKSRLKRLY